ncbi:MAG: SH3 domain-containing protein [Alphaproteobacteria bacterium]|nr:SH3 domain-containing protein [Alphaproteobacteria bacterium]MBU2380288.1 SH3 domain-containing protein [Alphaproteobacteria bacterium]
MNRKMLTAALTLAMASISTVPAAAQNRDRTRVQQAQDAQMAGIPRCAQSLGSLSIVDGQPAIFRELRLSPPQTLLRVVVQRSGCFTLVDRGVGMDAAMRERSLAGDGMLRQGSNVGGGQVRSADYVLVAEVASQDQNAGGGGMAAGIAGSLIGGRLGGLVGGIRTQRVEANTVLSLTNVRTSEAMAVTEGYASRNNLSWGAGGGAGFGGAVGGGYESTEVGRIVAQAFISAYTDMVTQLGLLEGSNAAAEAPVQSYLVQQATTMRSAPDGGVVRALPEGLRLYPTGQRDGLWWEVLDDNDNLGWVQNDRLAPGR